MNTFLNSLHQITLGYLQSNPALQGIPILPYHYSDTQAYLTNQIQSTIGTCILVMPPMPTYIPRDLPGPLMNQTTITIHIVEQLYPYSASNLLNIAEVLTLALHWWSPPLAQCHSCMQSVEHHPWKFLESSPHHNRMELQFHLQTSLQPIA